MIISGASKGLAPSIEYFCSTSEKLHQRVAPTVGFTQVACSRNYFGNSCAVCKYLCVPLQGWVDDVFPSQCRGLRRLAFVPSCTQRVINYSKV